MIEGMQTPGNEIRSFTWLTLFPNTAGPADPVALSRERITFLKNISDQFISARREFVDQVATLRIASLPLGDVEVLLKVQEAQVMEIPKPAHLPNRWTQYQQFVGRLEQRAEEALGGNAYIMGLLKNHANTLGVSSVSSLSFRDMDEAIPLTWNPIDVFQQNFSQIFAAYHRAWDQNKYNEFANQRHGEANVVLTEKEFLNRFGEPPWNFVNRLLAEAHLGFAINRPEGRAERPFEAKLRDKDTEAEVPFHDLSSGEKIIMSFVLCLYNVSDTVRQVTYPKLLLFDEVDAPLHPSMTQDLIRVIDRVLVKEKGVKVILTTHSPATVSFSPQGSLFRLIKHPHSLKPTSREDAIQLLTSGYISVTENTRFVITEAKADRLFYTSINRKLVERSKLKPTPNLVFLQATDRKDRTGGGHRQVREWGEKLPAAGLTQVLGLIDRDANNAPSATIKVIPRYSFENYLLDPLIIFAVLMQKGEHLSIYDAKIKDSNYYELPNLEQTALQTIADAVCAVIEKQSPQVTLSKGSFSVVYLSGKQLVLPQWLRDHNGHELEAAVRSAFQAAVRSSFILTRNECEDLADMMSERLPEFIPVDLLEVLEMLQA
jgi:hypothetical protein